MLLSCLFWRYKYRIPRKHYVWEALFNYSNNSKKYTLKNFCIFKLVSNFDDKEWIKSKYFAYRIRVYKTPLLIKPPLSENSIKIQINRHFFAQKSTFLGFFEQKLEKFKSNFNKPPP